MKVRLTGVLLILAFAVTEYALGVDPTVRGCTVITISQDGKVFFGGNDDYNSRDKAYWVDPGVEATYGGIYFGAPNNIQQGFNEAGLAYDANGLPSSPVRAHDGDLPGPNHYEAYPIVILRECATVEEVIEWVAEHRWPTSMRDQLHFADASGDAVVISVGADGRLAYTRKPAGDSYLVSVNFNVANPQNGNYPSWRYDLSIKQATELLKSKSVSMDRVASIMEAVHVENRRNYTVYTVVADLARRQVAVYFLFQYDAPIVLDIQTELAKGTVQTTLREMFPESTIVRADAAFERLAVAARTWTIVGILWGATVLLCVAIWAFLPVVRSSGVASLFAIAVLGPIGLLIGLFRNRALQDVGIGPARVTARHRHSWSASLSSAGLDSASIAMPLAACIMLMEMVPAIENYPASSFFLIVIPVVFSWLFVRAPALSLSTHLGFMRSVVRSAAPSILSGGVLVAAMLPLLYPFELWLAGRSESKVALVFAVWAVSAAVSLAGLFPLAVLYRGYKYPRSEKRWWRFGASALKILSGLLLSFLGLYLASLTIGWLAPMIEGAKNLP